MALDPVRNFAKVTVSGTYDADDTSITLATGDGALLPDPDVDGDFNLVWWNESDYPDPADDPDVEIVRVTTRVTDTLTVTRARESTIASAKDVAGKTYKMILAITKKMIDDIGALTSSSTVTEKVDNANCTQSGNDVVIDLTGLDHTFTAILLVFRQGQFLDPQDDWEITGSNLTVYNADKNNSFVIQYSYSS